MFISISPFALTPLPVAFGVPWLIKLENLFGRSTADQDAKNGIYRYSKGSIIFSQFGSLMLGMSWFLAIPLHEIANGSWIELSALPQITSVLILWFALECLLFGLSLYIERYTIKLDDRTLTVSAFGSRTIRYVDIIKFAVEPRARQSKRLKITVAKGNDVIFPGSLPKFDELVIDLRQHLSGAARTIQSDAA